MSSISATGFVAWLAAGAALGAFYFCALYHAVRLHAARAAAPRIVLLHLLRGAAALVVFWLFARQGALPLLSGLLGFLMARFLALRWMGSVQ